MPAADPDFAFDILRGVAAFTDQPLIGDLARAVSMHPDAGLSVAFNHKQIASKRWLLDGLYHVLGGNFDRITVLGGWYGVLPAMLLADRRFSAGHVTSVDIDPACAAVALTLNRRHHDAGAFTAATADMLTMDYQAGPDDLIINTSCEHLPDFAAWLARIPPGARLALQSNDYFREPDHASCFEDLAAFQAKADLSKVAFAGSQPAKNYTRFMLIGAR